MTEATPTTRGALPPFERVGVLSLSGVLLLFLAFAIQQIWVADVWWQLRTGQWVLEHGGVPAHDELSYTARDRPWIEMRWLYCVLAYLGWQAGGAAALILAKTAVLAATLGLLVWPARHAARTLAGVGTLVLGVLCAANRFVVRPELITYLLVAVYLLVLGGFARGAFRRGAWALPAAQVVWTNAHTLFVLGPILAWTFAVGDALRRLVERLRHGRRDAPSVDAPAPRWINPRLLVLAALITAACWLNPYGHRGVMFPWLLWEEIQPDHWLAQNIAEFGSPLRAARWTWDLWVAAALAAVSAISFGMNRRRTDPARLLIWGGFLYLATLATRNIALFAFVAAWATLQNLGDLAVHRTTDRSRPGILGRLRLAAHGAVFLLLCAAAWYVASDRFAVQMNAPLRFGLGVAPWATPSEGLDFILHRGARPQLFHSMADGGYVAWKAPSRFPVFLDGRLEVYGASFLAEAGELARRDFDALAGQHGINTVLLQHDTLGPLIHSFQRSDDWVLVHVDPRSLVYVRDIPEHAELIREYRVDLAQPFSPPEPEPQEQPTGWRRWLGSVGRPWYSLGMARAFLRLGSSENAARCLERGLAVFPHHAEIRLTLAQVYRARGRPEEADRLAAGLRVTDEMAVYADTLLVELLTRVNRREEAIAPLERLLRVAPQRAALHAELGEAYLANKDFAKARSAYQAAIGLSPDTAPLWARYAIACNLAGDRDAAIDAYFTALKHDPSQYQWHTSLGVLLVQRGEREMGTLCFEQALRINPDYEPARTNLNRLRRRR